MAPLQSGLWWGFFNRIKHPSLWSKNLLAIKLFAKYLQRWNRLKLRKINVICYQLKYIWIVRNRQKINRKILCCHFYYYFFFRQLPSFATTSSTLLSPVIQKRGNRSWGGSLAAPLCCCTRGCPCRLLSLRTSRSAVIPSQAWRKPQLQRGEHLFPVLLLCPCCLQSCFSHFLPSHLTAMRCFALSSKNYHRGTTSVRAGLPWACCGVGSTQSCPVRPCVALASPHRGPCRDTSTPSTNCVDFLWNCISALSCSCLYHLQPWRHWVSLEGLCCGKGERA